VAYPPEVEFNGDEESNTMFGGRTRLFIVSLGRISNPNNRPKGDPGGVEEGARWVHPFRDRSQWFFKTNGEGNHRDIGRRRKREDECCGISEDPRIKG